MEGLKDKADLFRANAIEFGGGDVGDVVSVEHDLTGARPIKTADEVDERRFARPGRPHDGDPLAGIDMEGNVVECVEHGAFAIAVGLSRVELADSFEPNHLFTPQNGRRLHTSQQGNRY